MLPNDDELDSIFNEDNGVEINQDTARYLQHIERKLYADIAARKRIDSGLLFLSCQVGASSLAWFLFSLQISISIILAMSMILALLPGLIDAGDSFHLELSSERWSVSHSKPLIALGKLVIGGVFGWNSTRKILTEVWTTEAQIQQTYTEIKVSQNPNTFIIPDVGLFPFLGLALAGLLVMAMRKKSDV